jgi:hypothetical protein
MAERSKAGLGPERLRTELFALFGLNPRKSLCVVGEQVDSFFELDHETYLLKPNGKRTLCRKRRFCISGVRGKSTITRGVFISINGVSQPAKDAISRGKQPLFFVMDGHELMMILSGQIALDEYSAAACWPKKA